ncbi:hypothetical protein [Patiriisocius sp. Uisw_017]|jgi:hypothetical protein|uniref:hypothetical protein n=1 Tax=Patiriisocius sp. Uisw_017 TaxID=3230968 RepID=UPI0039ED351D
MDDGEYFYSLKDSVWVSQKNEFSSDSTYLKQKVLHPKIDHQGISWIDDYFYVLAINEMKTKCFDVNSLKTLTEYGQLNDSLYMFINKENYFFVHLNTEKLSKVLNGSREFSGDFKYLRYHQVNNEVQLTGLNFVRYLGEDLRFKNLKSVP